MPSIFTHIFVGGTAGQMTAFEKLPIRFWVLSIILPVLPDADVLGFYFGLPYSHLFGHRGFFHSLTFALILALVVVGIFFRKEKLFSKRRLLLTGYFFVLTASHGILDAFTSGGKGIALLAPFDNTRYFSPFTPIRVSPIRPGDFFSLWGVRVILSEIVWVWVPIIIMAAAINIYRFNRLARGRRSAGR